MRTKYRKTDLDREGEARERAIIRARKEESRIFDEAFRFQRRRRRLVRQEIAAAVRAKDFGHVFRLAEPTEPDPEPEPEPEPELVPV